MIINFTAYYNGVEYNGYYNHHFYATDSDHPRSTNVGKSIAKFKEILTQCSCQNSKIDDSWLRYYGGYSVPEPLDQNSPLTCETLLGRHAEIFIGCLKSELIRQHNIPHDEISFDFACDKLYFVITGIV